LQQVLINLALNAMDAMQQQAPAKRQLSLLTVDGGAQLELHVADRGCGIGDAQHDKVFDSFVTTKPSGMGLGLSIVRSIVETHGGRVGFAPREGGGTTFSVTLPRRLGAVAAGALSNSSAAVVPT
jgi:signal transduction histidine kinase